MRTKNIIIVLGNMFLIYVLSITIACEFSVSTASLHEVKMCKSLAEGSLLCHQDAPVFTPQDTEFHLTTVLKYAPEDTKVTFAWFGFDQGKKVLIDSVTLRAGDYGSGSSYDLHSFLSIGEGIWPVGEYEVKIDLDTDNSTPIVKKFKVEA